MPAESALREQRSATDTGEPVTARANPMTFDDDVDVVPMGEAVGDRVVGRRVGDAKVLQRLVGEHDAPTERLAGAIALDDGDAVRRVRLRQQHGRVQTRGTTTDDHDAHSRTQGQRTDHARAYSNML